MNRQRLVLAVLLGLLACSLVISYLRMPRQKRVDKLTYVSGMKVPVNKTVKSRVNEENSVHLSLLDRNGSRTVSFRRNLFRNMFAQEVKRPISPLPPPPPPPSRTIKKDEPPEEVAPPPPVLVEPSPVQRDMARFTFLGFMKKDNRKTIFLSNEREIFVVKKGDRISGKYDVTSVTEDALTISSLQDGGEIIIPLVENRPLSAPKK